MYCIRCSLQGNKFNCLLRSVAYRALGNKQLKIIQVEYILGLFL